MMFVLMILLLLTVYNDSFAFSFHGKRSVFPSSTLFMAIDSSLESANTQVDIAIKGYIKRIKNTLTSKSIPNEKIQIREHPGFGFSFGIDKWKANDYEGDIELWSCPPIVYW